MKPKFRHILTILSLFVQEILFSQVTSISENPKLNSSRDMLGYDIPKNLKFKGNPPSLGLIVKALDSSQKLEEFISGIDKNVRVQAGCKRTSVQKWKRGFYDWITYGEIYWSMVDDTNLTFAEHLEIWEGGSLVRTIMIIRLEENNEVIGIIDIEF
jgi:hypothetical protein